MSFLLSFFLLMSMGFPGQSTMAVLTFFIACMPFIADTIISLVNVKEEFGRTSEVTEDETVAEEFV